MLKSSVCYQYLHLLLYIVKYIAICLTLSTKKMIVAKADENSTILYLIWAKCTIGNTNVKVDTKPIKISTKMC